MNKRVLITLLHNTKNSGLAAYARIYSSCSGNYRIFFLREESSLYSQWAVLFFFPFYSKKIESKLLNSLKDVDIVHICDNPVYSIFILYRLEKLGISTIYTLHDFTPHNEDKWIKKCKSLLVKAITMLTLSFIRRCTFVKLHSHQYIKALDFGKTIFVPHPLYHKLMELEKKAVPDVKSIGFFGRLDFYKGIDIFIEILRKLDFCEFNFKLDVYIVGQGDIELPSSINRLNIVFLNDFLPDYEFDYYLSNVDLLIMPYRSYTQSGILMKAITYDIPVVAHRKAEIQDFVVDSFNGILMDNLDVTKWSDVILAALNNVEQIGAYKLNNSKIKVRWKPDRIIEHLYS